MPSKAVQDAHDKYVIDDQAWWTNQPGFVTKTYHIMPNKPNKPNKPKRIKINITRKHLKETTDSSGVQVR